MLGLMLAALLAAEGGAEAREAVVEPPPPHANVITLDVFWLIVGEISLSYERATSRYTAIGVMGGYRFGGPGTMFTTMRLGGEYEYHFGSAVRFYPLGNAPLQLFISPGVEARVGREAHNASSYSVLVHTAALLTAGWSFHFFNHFALTLQGGLRVNSFSFFHNDDGQTTVNSSPLTPYLGTSLGVAF